MKLLLVLFSLFTLLPQSAMAEIEKRYVSDTLRLQLRSGPSSEYRIIKTLRSGEHLVLLETTDDKKYAKVKTPKETEGWVLARFLQDQPIAKEKLILAERELNKIKAELKVAQTQNAEFKQNIAQLKSERSGLSRDQTSLAKELARVKEVSANALALDEKNKELTLRTQELDIKLEALTAENIELKDARHQNFLMYGGGLVILGLLLGFIAPNLRGKKSQSGWV